MKKDKKLSAAMRDVERALRKLDSDQGRVARANARKRVLAQLRKLRGVVDAEYPAIPKAGRAAPLSQDPVKVKARKTRRRRDAYRKLAEADFVEVTTEMAAKLATERVRLRKGPRGEVFAPKWAVYAIEHCPSRIRKALKSSDERQVLAGLARLQESSATPTGFYAAAWSSSEVLAAFGITEFDGVRTKRLRRIINSTLAEVVSNDLRRGRKAV